MVIRDKEEKVHEDELLHQRQITSVVAITPVYNEEIYTIQHFNSQIEEIKNTLINRKISFRHFFLDDSAINLPREEVSSLIAHTENKGLVHTLIDGYDAVLNLKSVPDLIIRLDAQEHSPFKIIEIVDHMMNTEAKAVFLPIWYKTEEEPSPLTTEIYKKLSAFRDALTPMNEQEILSAYANFTLGYQSFTKKALAKILPDLKLGVDIFKSQEGKNATWGLDLLAILLTSHHFKDDFDFLWGGWSIPWKLNRGLKKTDDQKERARKMIQIAEEIIGNKK